MEFGGVGNLEEKNKKEIESRAEEYDLFFSVLF